MSYTKKLTLVSAVQSLLSMLRIKNQKIFEVLKEGKDIVKNAAPSKVVESFHLARRSKILH